MSDPALHRRGFLGLLGATAALSTLAQLSPGRLASVARAADPAGSAAPPERFFSEREREILTQVVERLVETGEPSAPAVRATGAIDGIDRLCAGLDPELTRPLPILLELVEWSPFVFDLAFARFTRLDRDAQDASLRGWMTSRFALRRRAFLALRNLASFGYWSQPETWPLIGYAGPLLRAAAAPEEGRS
jgi:hypothetical protein